MQWGWVQRVIYKFAINWIILRWIQLKNAIVLPDFLPSFSLAFSPRVLEMNFSLLMHLKPRKWIKRNGGRCLIISFCLGCYLSCCSFFPLRALHFWYLHPRNITIFHRINILFFFVRFCPLDEHIKYCKIFFPTLGASLRSLFGRRARENIKIGKFTM